jgi:hypothetical protein
VQSRMPLEHAAEYEHGDLFAEEHRHHGMGFWMSFACSAAVSFPTTMHASPRP